MKLLQQIADGVHLFPFTAESILMLHILRENDIATLGIYDNDSALWGESYSGCVIQEPDKLYDKPVIICGHRHYEHCSEFTKSIKIEEIIETMDIAAAIEQIDYETFERLAPRQKLRMQRIDYDIRQVLLPTNCLSAKKPLIINSVNLLLTSRCTLRCKNCSDLMQYYTHPRDVPFNQVQRDIDTLFANIDFVRNITLVGGEPLLYSHLTDVVKQIASYRERIGVVWVTTNGTLLPSTALLEELKRCDGLLRISDYLEKSGRKSEILEMCRNNGTRVELISYGNYFWREGKAPIYPPCADDEENSRKFLACQSRVICNSVYNGKYYFCEFIAHIEELQGIPYDARNSLPLNGATKESIREYFSRHDYAPGCAYCTGDNIHDMPSIEPAVQTSTVLPYHSFSETYDDK